MKEITISFKATVDEKSVEELKRIVDHHLNWLINLDEFPEIKTVYDATIKED